MQLTIGCDPEVFLQQNGEFLSAFGIFQGTKEKPVPVDKGAIQVDGMAVEFNIEPASNINEFVDNISTVMSAIRKQFTDGMDFDYKSTVKFTEDYFFTRCEEEVVLGCDPDWCAYSGEYNDRPDMFSPMRTAGGHVHVGLGEFEDTAVYRDQMRRVIILMDMYLGIPSLLLDTDDERRKMYGKAGALRYKPYGVEYRSLSNFWIKSPELMAWVFKQTELAVSKLQEFDYLIELVPDAQEVINTCDRNRARDIIAQLNIELP